MFYNRLHITTLSKISRDGMPLAKKYLIPILIILILAALFGANFMQFMDIYPNSRGGYTYAEIYSAVAVVNGGNIMDSDFDRITIRANEPEVRISILGSGFERMFNITVTNVLPEAVIVNGSFNETLAKGNNNVTFSIDVPPRLVADAVLTPIVGMNYTFAVVGDSRGNPGQLYDILMDAGSRDPLFIIHLGDLVNDGAENEYKEVADLLASSDIPVYTVVGNHDIRGGGRQIYSRNFGMYYYSFDLGTSHFILLDNSMGHLGREQMEWLEDDLRNNNASNVMLFMHMPVFDPRTLNDHAMTKDDEVRTLIKLIDDFDVDVVFSAHIHSYFDVTQNDTRYIITGGGGAPLQPDNPGYHYVLADISGENMTINPRIM